jgi:hypothetical protein
LEPAAATKNAQDKTQEKTVRMEGSVAGFR